MRGRAACSLPLPLCPGDWSSGGDFGTVSSLANHGGGGQLGRGLCGSPRGAGASRAVLGAAVPLRVRAVTLSKTLSGGAKTRLARAAGESAGGLGQEPGSRVGWAPITEHLQCVSYSCRTYGEAVVSHSTDENAEAQEASVLAWRGLVENKLPDFLLHLLVSSPDRSRF